MTVEQLVRDQLDRATRHVPGGPDLEAAVSTGRRRRRNRRVGLVSGVVAAAVVVGLGPVGVRALTTDEGSAVRDTPVADAPAAPAAAADAGDYVPGTDFDETMAAVVAEHLSSLPAPDDVYPSDSHTAGPIPDADFARAEDWQATYTTDVGQALVISGLPVEIGGWRCSDCDSKKVAGGTLYHQTYSTDGNTWWFGTFFVSDDGRFVNAFEAVDAPDEQTAADRRLLTDGDLESLVQDPRLGF
jgi:hypothetical protein